MSLAEIDFETGNTSQCSAVVSGGGVFTVNPDLL